jgi:hypothetical protein
MTDAELDPAPADAYYQSAQQLFALLPTDQAGDSASARYYKVTWDTAEPGVVNDITTMTASPTGARRQERYGLFYSAQFKVTETTSSGDTTERFVWCYTGPRRTRTPIEPDLPALAKTHDYQRLTPDNIVKTLTERASSIDDYLTLTRVMRQYDAQPVPSLVASINNLTYRLLYRSFDAPGESAATPSKDKIFELINTFAALNTDMPRAVQGYLISQALRTISVARMARTGAASETADKAAVILEEAIGRGVIPDEPRTMDRVFANGSIYTYPFATELVHAKLQAAPNYGSAKYVFGVKRVALAVDYIAAVVEARSTPLSPQIDSFIRANYLSGREEGAPEHLYDLLNGLVQLVSAPQPSRRQPPAPMVHSLTDAKGAFAYLLSAIGNEEGPTSEAQVAFDTKCVEVVEMVLAPLIRRRVGKPVVSSEVSEEQ